MLALISVHMFLCAMHSEQQQQYVAIPPYGKKYKYRSKGGLPNINILTFSPPPPIR